MKRLAAFFLIGMFGVLSPLPAFSEEGAAAPAAPVSTSVPPPPALRPIVITFSGSLSSVDSKSTPPVVEVEDRYGVEKKIVVPDSAQIAASGKVRPLKELKLGQGLTVEYTYDVATGTRTALKITAEESS